VQPDCTNAPRDALGRAITHCQRIQVNRASCRAI
jgi:hypothetical protein